jgi:hypothetical protein
MSDTAMKERVESLLCGLPAQSQRRVLAAMFEALDLPAVLHELFETLHDRPREDQWRAVHAILTELPDLGSGEAA